MDTPPDAVAAVVLCGGRSRRFGADKTRADLGGLPVLDHVLRGLPRDWAVVCAGEERATTRPVRWCREDPPGGGPVAGIATALGVVRAPIVVLLGGDMPYAARLAPSLADRLAAEPSVDAVTACDREGRVQPLLAAYRRVALQAALPEAPAGTPLMRLLDDLATVSVAVPSSAVLDVDTPEDLERARHRLGP